MLWKVCKDHAGVAQLVEQLIRNEKVEGSTPFSGTKTQKATSYRVAFFTCVAALTFGACFFVLRVADVAASTIRLLSSFDRSQSTAVLKSSVQNSLGVIDTGCNVAISFGCLPWISHRPTVNM